MNEEMRPFLQVFLQEAHEQIELLEQDILKLEQEPSPELLQEIFRAAHTLKGAARAMGYQAMGELTHAMEDLFDLLRNRQIEVTPELVDALFQGLDALKAMLGDIADSGTTQQDTSALTAQLRAVARCEASTTGAAQHQTAEVEELALSESTMEACQQALATGHALYRIDVFLAPDSMLKSVRALMTLQGLETVGAVLHTQPDEEALENERFETSFTALVATSQAVERLRAEVERISEVTEVRIVPWMPPTSANPQTAAEQTPFNEEVQTASREEPPKESGPRTAASPQPQTVRVDVNRLDNLMNLIGELVIDRTRIAQLCAQIGHQLGNDVTVEHLQEVAVHIARITDQLQDEVMKARMLPIENVFNRFPRMMRDLAKRLNKEFQFEIEGKETELDRSVIEAIGDPLIHMLRNSVDHGIEPPEERERLGKPRSGTVWLRARHQENHIVIEVEDDGRGIDPAKMREAAVKKGLMSREAAHRLSDREAINLIFASGFSTAQQVSDVSGRGVGMDIVRSNLQRLGATIDIESWVGKGTRFCIRLPLTLAIIRSLLVRVGEAVYAIPLNSVAETLRVSPQSVRSVRRQPTILLRGETLCLAHLQSLLPVRATQSAKALAVVQSEPMHQLQRKEDAVRSTVGLEALNVVVVGLERERIGLIVDGFIGEQEIVIKTLGKFIGDVQGVSGATILGDGRMALILDVEGILNLANHQRGVKAHAA
ncbi:MAG TPA: chemotaxis protein CheA [Chthonomonas sp.]|uniref:chemotaxis protein CheA n=1 Tax=Chthonomonas sp. TaxID=2282153 RepID=UPI002B4AC044|nr:chemotaxis protein CheA [Chthonomonas sp.]HLI48241.1 chemotaxis protein CheA [Chthonomonas sp.]